MSIRVDGKKIAQDLKKNILKGLYLEDTPISFHIVYVGSDPVIDNFVRYKKQFGKGVGVDVVVHNFASNIQQELLIHEIKNICDNSHGVIIQLPLPDHLDRNSIVNTVPQEKDIDVLSLQSQKLFSQNKTNFFPPVTGAIVQILKQYSVSLKNKNIVLIGNGALVGYPMSLWLEREGYEYTIIDNRTDENIKNKILKNADIIISGAGVPYLITPDLIKENVVLIDAGTSESGKKVIGDIHPDCEKKAHLFTPVPGGIGPITIAVLYQNLIHAYNKHYD